MASMSSPGCGVVRTHAVRESARTWAGGGSLLQVILISKLISLSMLASLGMTTDGDNMLVTKLTTVDYPDDCIINSLIM